MKIIITGQNFFTIISQSSVFQNKSIKPQNGELILVDKHDSQKESKSSCNFQKEMNLLVGNEIPYLLNHPQVIKRIKEASSNEFEVILDNLEEIRGRLKDVKPEAIKNKCKQIEDQFSQIIKNCRQILYQIDRNQIKENTYSLAIIALETDKKCQQIFKRYGKIFRQYNPKSISSYSAYSNLKAIQSELHSMQKQLQLISNHNGLNLQSVQINLQPKQFAKSQMNQETMSSIFHKNNLLLIKSIINGYSKIRDKKNVNNKSGSNGRIN